MPSRNRSALFINNRQNAFTLIEIMAVIGIFALLAAAGFGISFSQYNQWMALTLRENKLDTLIENRHASQSTTTVTITPSFGTFAEPIIVYTDGELAY